MCPDPDYGFLIDTFRMLFIKVYPVFLGALVFGST
jgi:hypothetical protein